MNFKYEVELYLNNIVVERKRFKEKKRLCLTLKIIEKYPYEKIIINIHDSKRHRNFVYKDNTK